MTKGIILLLVLFSYMVDALSDGIDHAKGATTLYEIWHLLKGLKFLIPYSIILYLLGVGWKVYPLLWLALWIYWQVTYRLARYFEIEKLDDKIRIPFIKKIWS